MLAGCLPIGGGNSAQQSLHEGAWAGCGFDGPLLEVVHLLKFLLNPGVPQVEGNFLLLALNVEFAGRHREHKVSVLLVVDDFERQTTLYSDKIEISKAFSLVKQV